jgi:hypothetical protein
MRKYSDLENQSGLRVLFMFLQMCMLLFVFAILYTTYVGVGAMLSAKGGSVWFYFPLLLAAVAYPIVLHSHRKMFTQGKMLSATVWTISFSAVMIVALYLYLDKLVA